MRRQINSWNRSGSGSENRSFLALLQWRDTIPSIGFCIWGTGVRIGRADRRVPGTLRPSHSEIVFPWATQRRRKRNLTHEWPHKWAHEWTHECAHESAHDSPHSSGRGLPVLFSSVLFLDHSWIWGYAQASHLWKVQLILAFWAVSLHGIHLSKRISLTMTVDTSRAANWCWTVMTPCVSG